MSKVKKILLPFIIIIAGIVIAGMMFSMKKPPQKKPQTVKPLLVDVAIAHKLDLNHVVKTQGTVRPLFNTVLVSEVNGKIVALSDDFIAGGFFNKGDVLVRIDPSDYQTTVKTAEANLARAQAALQEEKARAKVAEVEWNAVMKGDAPDLYLRKPQLARELANVRSAEADLEKAQRDLERTVIRAPFNGMLKSKSADLGQFISRGSNLGTVYGTQIAEIRLPLTDNDLAYLDMPSANMPGQTPEVTLSARVANQTLQWSAQLVRSEGVIDEKTRVTYAVAQLKDPYGLKNGEKPLSFGRFVKARIKGHHVENIIRLPRHLLTADNTVLIFADGKLDIRPVDVLRADEDYAYISKGLDEGEQYIVSVVPNPMNGLALRTDDEDEKPDENKASTAIVKAGN